MVHELCIISLQTYPEASLPGCLLDTVQKDAAGSLQFPHASSSHRARCIQEKDRVQRHLTGLYLQQCLKSAQSIPYECGRVAFLVY